MQDSLQYLAGVDSLAAQPLSQGGVECADTLFSEAPVVASSIYRDCAVTDIFGEGSSLADGVSVVETFTSQGVLPAAVAWPEVMLNLLVAVVSALYIFCIYRYYYDVIALIQTAMQRDIMVSERNNERRRSDIFYGFLGKLLLLGVGFVAIFVAFWAIHHSEAVFSLSSQQQLLSPLVGVGLFVAVALMQYLILFLVGLVTRSLAMASALTQMRLTYFVLATIVVAPLLLLAEVASAYRAWYIVAIITACVVLVLYLRESVGAFISKKISILHWILYLCAVEIMPVTLLWQAVVRLS